MISMVLLWGGGHRSLAITQASGASSTAAQDNIGLQLTDPKVCDFPMDGGLREKGPP